MNFSTRFELLSETFSGFIFTFSSSHYKNLPLGNFRLFGEIATTNIVSRFLKGIWVRILLPICLLGRKGQIDAIITYDPYVDGIAGMILKRYLRAKLIVEVNGDYHKLVLSENALKGWLKRIILHISLCWADAIKVLNRDQEEYFHRCYPGKKVYRFPDFVATEYFRSLECYQGDYLLSVGYPFDLKGVDVLIRAFKRISHDHPAVNLRIMGYCPEKELGRYKELAGDDERIEFIKPGWIEDVGEQMRGCYALVNAARSEAMGRVHLEAMACGKPVVATRTNGGVDYIVDYYTGLLCEIENVEDLATKLDQLLSKQGIAEKMGQAGLERLKNKFSETQYVTAFQAMLDEVISPKID